MDNMFKLFKVSECSENQKAKIDSFIMKESTTGEFINTIKYLDYHKNRFVDDSIVVINTESDDICCVLMGVNDSNEFISHKGTTFSGFIIETKNSFEKNEMFINMIVDYLESKYSKITIKQLPNYYSFHPTNLVEYILLKKNYQFWFSDFVNMVNISCVTDQESLFYLYNSKRRNEVRKVINNDEFIFEKGNCIELDVWKSMNQTLKDRYDSKTTHTYEEIYELKSMFNDNIVPYYVRTKDREYAAFGLIYKFKNVFHTQYLDLNYKFANKYPNLLLINNLILEARKEGYSYFSFGGCTTGSNKDLNVGLFNYKSGFGGGNVLLPVYKKVTVEEE